MKKFLVLLLMISTLLLLVACSKAEGTTVKEKVKAVKVEKIQQSENSVFLSYIGTVDAKDIIKYSFKTSGKIGRVFVEKGDKVKEGDKLVQLDTQDLKFQVDAAKSTLDTAQFNIKKAKDSYIYDKDYFSKMKKLYDGATISKNEYDQIKLKMDMSETTYNQAKSQYEVAKTDYEYKLSLLDDSTIYATITGSVVDTLYKERELAPEGNPVAIVRSKEQIINIGIAQKDLKKIKLGTKAISHVDGEKVNGVITNIAEAPDEDTRTYKGEITVNEKHFKLGSIAQVELNVGMEKGVWIPIASIMSDGENYVYIVKENRVYKRTVQLGNINKDHVMINGVKDGEFLVVSGMKNLNDGLKVNITK
ncbi:efflux RND transporter periplasmic adaptor subunit [Anaeromicrobium sediminis]|nr:efflux RND transporter periplasmic adaptor subunit [Anaeromicrobium sediminis]